MAAGDSPPCACGAGAIFPRILITSRRGRACSAAFAALRPRFEASSTLGLLHLLGGGSNDWLENRTGNLTTNRSGVPRTSRKWTKLILP